MGAEPFRKWKAGEPDDYAWHRPWMEKTGLDAHVEREEERFVVHVRDPDDPGRWAAATHRPGERDHQVYQMGDRPLWDELVDACFRWVSWGGPGHERFGLTVSPDGGQSIWLDSPERVLAP
ncbi:hypothetical protein GCM10009733_042460 [Nonomuraea maheshkhaliensis]|uniref:Uncharacterized protein n=1 Tax=Nonomuraea maheshkhaliensis TaxID=419590 RepID=A0ABN2FE19_9ACTN